MSQKLIIISEEHRTRLMTIIKSLPLAPVQEVVIRDHKKDRSAEQNSLLWKWYTLIANELGESKEDVHERYKDKFLVNIYERDCPDFAEMIQSLRAVWTSGMKVEAVALRKKIVSLSSTTTATVAQMTEYLQEIERDAAKMAIMLPHPEERA